MKPQVGQYHYSPHGRGFRIYRYTEVTDNFQSASPVLSEPIFYDREKAKKRVKAEMEERQRKEAEEREAERKRKEEEEKQKAEMARQQAEMNGLFSEQASMQNYQPKVKVTQKIELLNPEGIMPILSMWWSKEGCTLSVEELSKLFKKQITFCEKLANKDSVYIENESVQYIDDVKAK